MIVKKYEYHQLTSTLTYEIDDKDIIEEFGSLETFEDECAKESDKFWEFVCDYDYDREDDLWTDRKGGYDVEWEIESEEEDVFETCSNPFR